MITAAWLTLRDSTSRPVGMRHAASHMFTSASVSPSTSRPNTSANLPRPRLVWFRGIVSYRLCFHPCCVFCVVSDDSDSDDSVSSLASIVSLISTVSSVTGSKNSGQLSSHSPSIGAESSSPSSVRSTPSFDASFDASSVSSPSSIEASMRPPGNAQSNAPTSSKDCTSRPSCHT